MENLLQLSYAGLTLGDLGRIALIIIMFAMGLTLKLSDFIQIFHQPKAIVAGLSMQLLFLPALAFTIAWGLSLSPALAIGLVILSVSPGGAPSNIFTYLIYGDIALSVSMTAISGFVTLLTIPLFVNIALGLFASAADPIYLPVIPTMVQVFLLTALPVLLGMLVYRVFPARAPKWQNVMSRLGILVLLMIFVLFCHAMWNSIGILIKTAGGLALLMNLLGLSGGYYAAHRLRLSAAQCRTIAVGVGLQNCLMGFVIAFSLLKRPEYASVSLAYLLVMVITTVSYVSYYRYAHDASVPDEPGDLSSRPGTE